MEQGPLDNKISGSKVRDQKSGIKSPGSKVQDQNSEIKSPPDSLRNKNTLATLALGTKLLGTKKCKQKS